MSYFREFDPAGRTREDLPSGWEEARKVTSILVDAITPKDHYTGDHALQVARRSLTGALGRSGPPVRCAGGRGDGSVVGRSEDIVD